MNENKNCYASNLCLQTTQALYNFKKHPSFSYALLLVHYMPQMT